MGGHRGKEQLFFIRLQRRIYDRSYIESTKDG